MVPYDGAIHKPQVMVCFDCETTYCHVIIIIIIIAVCK